MEEVEKYVVTRISGLGANSGYFLVPLSDFEDYINADIALNRVPMRAIKLEPVTIAARKIPLFKNLSFFEIDPARKLKFEVSRGFALYRTETYMYIQSSKIKVLEIISQETHDDKQDAIDALIDSLTKNYYRRQ